MGVLMRILGRASPSQYASIVSFRWLPSVRFVEERRRKSSRLLRRRRAWMTEIVDLALVSGKCRTAYSYCHNLIWKSPLQSSRSLVAETTTQAPTTTTAATTSRLRHSALAIHSYKASNAAESSSQPSIQKKKAYQPLVATLSIPIILDSTGRGKATDHLLNPSACCCDCPASHHPTDRPTSNGPDQTRPYRTVPDHASSKERTDSAGRRAAAAHDQNENMSKVRYYFVTVLFLRFLEEEEKIIFICQWRRRRRLVLTTSPLPELTEEVWYTNMTYRPTDSLPPFDNYNDTLFTG